MRTVIALFIVRTRRRVRCQRRIRQAPLSTYKIFFIMSRPGANSCEHRAPNIRGQKPSSKRLPWRTLLCRFKSITMARKRLLVLQRQQTQNRINVSRRSWARTSRPPRGESCWTGQVYLCMAGLPNRAFHAAAVTCNIFLSIIGWFVTRSSRML